MEEQNACFDLLDTFNVPVPLNIICPSENNEAFWSSVLDKYDEPSASVFVVPDASVNVHFFVDCKFIAGPSLFVMVAPLSVSVYLLLLYILIDPSDVAPDIR